MEDLLFIVGCAMKRATEPLSVEANSQESLSADGCFRESG